MLNALRHNLNVLESVATSSFAAWRGCLVVSAAEQPEKPIILYDMEACPYCRRVREVLTALHLDVEIRPCPKDGRV
ncbi:MAG: glutathione S-transferase N-terminal domain-containing protein, partial [Marinobacter sp.]|nr:glutathione S-transferase N-terminal domain-containing protein [Marinobacter sp.]